MRRYTLHDKAPTEVHKALGEHPEFIRELLFSRGIRSRADAETFLTPSFERDSHDPFLLPDMERAVDRILSAITRGERTAIWSDYDCDGIPGGALLHDFFREIGFDRFTNYIPHRHEEGYGLNERGIGRLKEEGVSLIITVDCGITDHAAVARANELGIDVIVTDHHLPRPAEAPGKGVCADDLPPAHAVINPKRSDSRYPFDGLSGTGVAWKLVQAILRTHRFGVPEGREKWLLDLVGIATVADMMPLVGENRALAHFGLLVLRKSPRLGLRKLLALARTNQRFLTEDDIGFTIAPRVNAASRMDAPDDAFRLLISRDEQEAAGLAKRLEYLNSARKGVVASTVKEIKERIGRKGAPAGLIVMGNPSWRPGLLGLVAGNIAEQYGKPVCLWGREGGDTIKGSCRSDGSVNVVELMRATNESFIDFGGHKFSGGFALHGDHVHTIAARFAEAYERVRSVHSEEEVRVDLELALEDATRDTLHRLSALSPFGEQNPKPLFLFPGVEVSSMRMFGKTKEHLELSLVRGTSRIKGISFYQTPEHFTRTPHEGVRVDVVAHLERDAFAHGAPRLRLVDVL